MKPGGISVFEDDISHAISILPDSLAGNELTNTRSELRGASISNTNPMSQPLRVSFYF